MLTHEELHTLFELLQLPEIGRARIRHIRDSLPSRAVRSNKVSAKAKYAPLKMPFTIDAEANSTEYIAAVEWDHDPETLEFYPQPLALKIRYLTADRIRWTSTHTTPDYLRITPNRVVFVECKTEDALKGLAKAMPGRFQRDELGRWRSPPAEEAAAAFGCEFEIRSSAQNNWALFENLELLKDYFIGDPGEPPAGIAQALMARLGFEGWASMHELVHNDPGISADVIYTLISQRRIYFPLTSQRLSDQEQALVFRDEATFKAHQVFLGQRSIRSSSKCLGIAIESGCLFTWDAATWQVINDGKERLTIKRLADGRRREVMAELGHGEFFALVQAGRITIHSTEEEAVSLDDGRDLMRRASTQQLREAVWRLEVLQGRADPGTNPFTDRQRRARMYWQAKFRRAEAKYGNGFVGLLIWRGSNRKPRASHASLELANEVIVSDWETIRGKKRLASWGKYSVLAGTKGLDPVSYVRFCQLVKARSGHAQLVTRLGEKAAYNDEPHYLELEWTTPRHGVRPWHIAHIDHTPLPLKLVHSSLGTIVSTVWLTILLDANTRKVLAYYLSFDPPSYRSCMMVLRDCVRRHNRVPQIMVCDQGSDFHSVYWETQLARLYITKRERRAGRPRSGSVCERLFNTSQSQFVKVLMGSTDLVERYFRRISPEVDPTRHAVWTLERFDEGFERYLNEVYHVGNHAGLGMSPNAAWSLGIQAHGQRSHRAIPYDRDFIVASCPAVRKGKARVTPAGIKVNYVYFKCPEFNMPGVLGSNVEARYDPFNAGLAYAYVNGQWHSCHSDLHPMFQHYSERAVRLATERLKLRDRSTGQKQGINAERLAMFLQEREQDEDLGRQLLNDTEAARHRQRNLVPSRLQSALAIPQAIPTNDQLRRDPRPATPVAPTSRRPIRVLEDL